MYRCMYACVYICHSGVHVLWYVCHRDGMKCECIYQRAYIHTNVYTYVAEEAWLVACTVNSEVNFWREWLQVAGPSGPILLCIVRGFQDIVFKFAAARQRGSVCLIYWNLSLSLCVCVYLFYWNLCVCARKICAHEWMLDICDMAFRQAYL